MAVNIAVLLDGTWSDANTHTNIAQIHARMPRRVAGSGARGPLHRGGRNGPLRSSARRHPRHGSGRRHPRGIQLHRVAPPLRCRPDPSHRLQPWRVRRTQPGRHDRQVRDHPRNGPAGEGGLRSVPRHQGPRPARDAGGREARAHRRGRAGAGAVAAGAHPLHRRVRHGRQPGHPRRHRPRDQSAPLRVPRHAPQWAGRPGLPCRGDRRAPQAVRADAVDERAHPDAGASDAGGAALVRRGARERRRRRDDGSGGRQPALRSSRANGSSSGRSRPASRSSRRGFP